MYLTLQSIIGIALFLTFILLFIISTRFRTILISHVTRHACVGDICPTSISLIAKDSLNRTVTFINGLRSYLVLFFIKDDGSQVQYFKGYLPSLSNSWVTVDLMPDIRLFNLAISGDGVHITDLLIPYPSGSDVTGGPTTPFDIRTGEPTGVVSFMSIRRALSTELSEKVVQSMSLTEITRRTRFMVYLYDGAYIENYMVNMPKLLALLGLQMNGDIKLIDGSPSTNYKRKIKCPMLANNCFSKAIKVSWGWWSITEALLSLVLAIISAPIYLYIIAIPTALIIYLALIFLLMRVLGYP